METDYSKEVDYSKEALMRFLNYVIEKGLVNVETGKSWRVAVSKLLVDLSPMEETDVRAIDIETAARKFANRNGGSYMPASLTTYRSRVMTAIQEFTNYVNDPASYKPRSLNGKPRKSEVKNRSVQPAKATSATLPFEMQGREAPPVSAGLSLPYPIRTDFLAQVVIPRDLTVEEAKRLGAFLLTLATDFKPSEV